MSQCLGPFDNITYNKLRKLNKMLAAYPRNKLRYEYTNGMLFLVSTPTGKPLAMHDHVAINKELREYGCKAEDIGK